MKTAGWITTVILCVFLSGCSLLEPTSKVDTDGDGTPDREMTADQAVLWGKQQEAKKREEAEQAKQQARAKLRRVERDFQATIDNVTITSQSEVNRLKGKLDDSIAAIGEELESTLSAKKIEFENVGQTVNAALSDIDRKAELVSGILPIAQSAAGMIPGGGLIASAIGILGAGWVGRTTGRKTGETIGVAKGRDLGWTEHEEHQKNVIDPTWDAAHLQALLTAGLKPPTSA